MDKKFSIYFFCPAYKDEGNIEKVVSSAVKVLGEAAGNYLVTIVEDGSPDRTGEIADRLAEKYRNVRVIHHPVNRGYGAALKTGFTDLERNNYDLIAYTDGDGQFDLEELKAALPLLEGHDGVIGYRKNYAEGWRRKFQSWVYNSLTRSISGLRFRDFNCSFKILRREILEHMEIEFPTVFIDAEIVIKAALAGYSITEIGVTHYKRIAGKGSGAKWSLITETIKSMREFRRRLKKGGLKYTPRNKVQS